METGIYLRVSTEEQAQEGYSIRAQEQKLKDFARIKDWSIYGIYADEGISGKNITERPAINRLIEDVKKGRVKNVLVFKIDRLTRSTADLIYLVDLFNEHDCAFNSLMESIDTQTASGRMFLKIIGIFAEFERENIGERVRVACERKAKEGYSLCCLHASYGYDRPKGQEIQTVKEDEAVVVREIFDLFVNQNISMMGIAKRLNVRKVPTKHNAVWTAKTIKLILTNCNYIGKVRYHMEEDSGFEVDGLHEPIISPEIFEEAQRLMEVNPTVNFSKKPRDENYFLGFIRCPQCGRRYVSHGTYPKKQDGTGHFVGAYRCHGSSLHACKSSSMTHAKLERAFCEYMEGLGDIATSQEIALDEQQQAGNARQEQLAGYEERLLQLDGKEREVMDLYVADSVSFEQYRQLKERIDRDRDFILSEIERLQEQEEEQNLNREDIVLNFKRNWVHLTDVEKRKFLLRFIEKIVVVNEIPEGERFGVVRIVEVVFRSC